jgi:hypothetical protein
MRRDCPHCLESLEGDFVLSFRQKQTDHMRSCPICGKGIEPVIHREELVIRALAIGVAIATLYWMNTRRHGFLTPLVVGTAVLIVAYGVARARLKNAQRYRKGS